MDRSRRPASARGEHCEVQSIAKRVLRDLGETLTPTDSERAIAERAVRLLAERGIADTWYYACPALVLLGTRSCLSVSGRDYMPADEPIGDVGLVTIDLSPARGHVWGDCARSFFIEDGRATDEPRREDFRHGRDVERRLHDAMRAFVRPETTFGELFAFGNAEIERHGYENLDYRGNLGHSIETSRDRRRYIERGADTPLAAVKLFTFEPHICRRGRAWGFKHEDIYYFDETGGLATL